LYTSKEKKKGGGWIIYNYLLYITIMGLSFFVLLLLLSF